MWLDRMTYSPTTNALALSATFSEQRNRVLADNVANLDTPDYLTKQLDPKSFQASLRTALERERTPGSSESLELRDNAQFATRADGTITVKPAVEPPPNKLFHDGTNSQMEQLLADVADNALTYEFSTTLLRGQFLRLLQAIKGRVA